MQWWEVQSKTMKIWTGKYWIGMIDVENQYEYFSGKFLNKSVRINIMLLYWIIKMFHGENLTFDILIFFQVQNIMLPTEE